MPASKRREKERRRARQQADARRVERRREEEAELAAVVEQIRARTDVFFSAEHPVEEAVDQLAELFTGDSRHLDTPLGELVAIRSGPERARALAAAALARAPEGVVELQVAAQVAHHVDDDPARAAELYERALANAGEAARPVLERALAEVCLDGGRLADGLAAAEAACAADPLDDDAQQVYAELLTAAWARLGAAGDEAGEGLACACGSGDAYAGCCRPRERAAIDRFRDRSSFDELREALHRFVQDRGLGNHLQHELEAWVAEARFDQLPLRGPERDQHLNLLGRLSGEHALLLRPDTGDGSGAGAAGGPEAEAERDESVLGRFAADPATPPDQARRARDWVSGCRYGAWRIGEPVAAPGAWVVDVVSARRVYVAFAPEQLEGLARWSVLLGVLVPVDGVWRSGGAFLAAGPAEGDELAEQAHWTAEMVGETLAAEASSRRRRQRPPAWRKPPKRPAVPRGVAVDLAEPAAPASADLYSKVVARVLPSFCGLVAARRLAGPRLTNTDGEPLVLINAHIAVPDAAAAWERLREHADLDVEHEGGDRPDAGDERPTLAWWGRHLTPEERSSLVERARAQLAERGEDPDLLDVDQPNRWLRGRVRLDGGGLSVEVNSEARLARFLDLLESVGLSGTVADADRVTKGDELAEHLRGVHLGAAGMPSEAAARAWAESWLGEELPALGGRTPREAASDTEGRLQLEGLLRQLEFDADVARHAGNVPADVAYLREQLDLPTAAATTT